MRQWICHMYHQRHDSECIMSASPSWSPFPETVSKNPSSETGLLLPATLAAWWPHKQATSCRPTPAFYTPNRSLNSTSEKRAKTTHFAFWCFFNVGHFELFQKFPAEPRWELSCSPLSSQCICPLNYSAKEMVLVMSAWLECCQAAVPCQPFPELLVISHAQYDSQRQMVFKLNGCGRNRRTGLIGHAHTRGLPRQGHCFQRHSLMSEGPVQTCHCALVCNFHLIVT